MTLPLIRRTLWNFFRPAAAFVVFLVAVSACISGIQWLVGVSSDTAVVLTILLGFAGIGFVWAYEQAKVDLEREEINSGSGSAAPSGGTRENN